MSDLIVSKDGRPYASEKAAKLQQGVNRKKGIRTRIVQHEGGWALQVIKRSEGRRKKQRGIIDKGPLAFDTRQKDPEYVYRVVRDVGMRVSRLEEEDWEIDDKVTTFSENDADREVSTKGSLRRHGGYIDGNEFKMVLMRKKKEYHDEDFEEKMAQRDREEESIKRKKPGNRDDGFYGDDESGAVIEFENP